MFSDLVNIINQNKNSLLTEICEKLHNSSGKHYSLISPADLFPQVQKLLFSLSQSLEKKQPDSFLDYIEKIAVTGFKEGYNIAELENNLNILAGVILAAACQHLPREQLGQAVSCLHSYILTAKDIMFQIYIEQYEASEQKLNHLKHEFDEFLKTRKAK